MNDMRRLKMFGLTAALAAVSAMSASQAMAACPPPAATWQQFIEEQAPPGNPANRASPSYYYTSQYFCDSEPDIDYVFVFRLNYRCNPDSLRWNSNDGLTQLLFDGLNSRSPVASDDDVHVCMGGDRLQILGGGNLNAGINWIFRDFYVWAP